MLGHSTGRPAIDGTLLHDAHELRTLTTVYRGGAMVHW